MNKDDILEDALNKGLSYSADKHGVTKEEVYDIVKEFKLDIEDLCSCDRDKMKGITSMCFMCDGHSNRIEL